MITHTEFKNDAMMGVGIEVNPISTVERKDNSMQTEYLNDVLSSRHRVGFGEVGRWGS